ncbi:unnamed protein product, partial [Schistosoma margrebowiei]
MGTGKETLLCDTSTGRDRPIVPKHYRRNVFNTLHKLSHPGVRATIKLIAERFCWPKLAQLQKEDTDLQQELSSTTLKLRIKQMGTGKETLLCDTSTGRDRPIVPKHYRRNVFNTLHKRSHPVVRATIELIAERFCWAGMNKDVREWARSCVSCQKSKVIRHNKCPL